MNFIRDNLFLVLVLVITVVLCGILLMMGMGVSTTIEDEQIAQREKLARSLQNIGRGNMVNQLTIHADKRRVEMLLNTLEKVRRDNLEFNSRYFSVPELQLLGGAKKPALPWDETTWNRNELAYRFVRQYHLQLDAMRQKLNATRIATTEEIETQALEEARRLERSRRIRAMWERDQTPGQDRAPRRAPSGPMEPGRSVPPGRAGRTEGKTNLTEEAKTLAVNSLRLHQARQGEVYLSELSFDVMFAKGGIVNRLEPRKIWDAQVNLWVQQDIAHVIARTNRSVLSDRKVPADERNVLNAPIKRLVRIEVASASQASAGRSSGRSTRRAPGGMPGENYGQQSSDPQQSRPATLTGYVDNKNFEVVNYSFTVLMPTRYLPELEKHLLSQNYHVILAEQIAMNPREARSGRNSGQNQEELYYYGTEPVANVTIEGQLLLVTDFTRGWWDAENQSWISPPLMPIPVMKQLPRQALREQDENLLEAVKRAESGQPLRQGQPRPTWLSGVALAGDETN
jgi:hypothetical protein